ncbi:Uncharacterized protein Adt_21714 [Abeliophyllum distichum]|uniref:Uncharacterized protein n=1 Tax=Abeliophyllum distichum TaxID=126358 RepID=A0ABD1T0B6_9LAMI
MHSRCSKHSEARLKGERKPKFCEYEVRVAKVRGNQTEARTCYINALRKVVKLEDALSTVMTIQTKPMDINLEKAEEDMVMDEGLDTRIIGSDSLASPAEELEAFLVNLLDPFQMLQLG